MAVTAFTLKVRALQHIGPEIKNGEFVWDGCRYNFFISDKDTVDADVKVTSFRTTDGLTSAIATKLITEQQGTGIQNNPAYADVKTDTDDDGTSNSDGTRYGWATIGILYEIVA